MHGIGQPDYRDADNRAAANVATAARDAGVRRIVYLGGFVPDDGGLSEHLAGRAEVAHALEVDGGPDVVWLGAAMIIGAGSTSFEMMRYVGDRFVVIPMPGWSANPIDPISIRDVVYYLVAAADADRVPAGGYDIFGPETTSYGDLLRTFARVSGKWRTGLPVNGVDTNVVSWLTGAVLPVPGGLASDLVESLDHPMMASDTTCAGWCPTRRAALSPSTTRSRSPCRVAARACQRARRSAPSRRHRPGMGGRRHATHRPTGPAVHAGIRAPGSVPARLMPGPVAGAVRTGLDTLIGLVPKAARHDAAAFGCHARDPRRRRTVAVPHHEPPSVIRRRRVVVAVVLVIGGALLGYSLTRHPGDASFYWLTLALAAVWASARGRLARCTWVACGSAGATSAP